MFRKILIATLLFGAAGAAIGAGTFASFSASTTNQNSTFATGTLTLTNRVNTATVCASSSGGIDTNANSGCNAVFTGLTGKRPGDAPTTANLALAPGGDLSATSLKFSGACDPADAGAGAHGTGDPCSAVQLYIQEYDGPFYDNSDVLLVSQPSPIARCVFPANASAACSTDFSGTVDVVDNLPSSLTQVTGLANGLSATRYFKVGIRLPTAATNNMQGRSANFSLTWSVT